MFDVQTFFGLRHRNAFTQMPQVVGLGQVFGDHSVADAFLLKGRFKKVFELRSGVGLVLGVGVLKQDKKRRVQRQRDSQVGKVPGHQTQGKVAHDFEAGQAGAQVPMGQAQQLHGVLQRGHGRPGRELGCRQGVELHGGRGDDAQRAL